MQKYIMFFKNKYTIALAIAAIAVAGMGLGFTNKTQIAQSAQCSANAPTSPVFGFWPINYDPTTLCTDAPLIDALNLSAVSGREARFAQSQAEHDAGITANPGDTILVSIYFHNGASDVADRALTTAHNVVIASNFSGAAITSHTISGTISASNASTVNSANLGGDILVQTPTPTTFSYVPGSANLCISAQHAQERVGSTAGLAACGPSGQDFLVPVNDGVVSGGVSLNDLKACFPFSGTLDFRVNVSGVAQNNPTLSITKQVQNISQGSGFSNSVNASQGDNVGYKITVTNTDNATTATSVSVSDTGVSGITFQSGTNFGNGSVGVGDLGPNQSVTLSYTAVVNASSGNLVNTASASASNANTVQSSASVIVNTVVLNPTLNITKQVQNISQGSGFSNSVNASQGDNLNYKITVTNVNNTSTATNVRVSDTGAPGITFQSGTNFGNGSANVGNLGPNQSVTLSYTAVVNASSGTLVNTASASASNASTVQSSASVIVNTIVPNVTLSITKQVQNVSQGGGFSNSVSAQQGNILNYRITVTNNSFSIQSGTANNVVVSDTGAPGITFQSGTNFGNSGVNIGNLGAGQSSTLSYTAVVNSGSGTLVNTASAVASNASRVQASASVFVNGNQQGSINITKQVANQSRGFGFSSSTTASVGDTVQYQIVVSNFSGNTVNNISVFDNIPFGLNFSPGTLNVNGSGIINPVFGGNSFSNIAISTLTPGQSVTITFNATVNQTGTLPNTATASSPNTPTVSATATVIVGGSTGSSQMNISKLVRNITTAGGFAKNITATSGNRVAFQVTVSNQGTNTLNNVIVNDQMPSGFSYALGSTRVDGNLTVDITSNNGRLSLGSMFQGQQHVITFEGTISGQPNSTFTNIALASADNASTVQDSASVGIGGVLGANVNLALSKRAFNDSKGADATTISADKEDFITYTLTVTNNGNATAQGYVIQDDLSNVLNLADFVDNGGGGALQGSTVVWSPLDIAAGQTVTKTFRVRVKFFLPNGSLALVNTFGNTVTINLKGRVLGAVFVAPKTGPTASLALGFGAFITLLFAIFRKALSKEKLSLAFARILKR